MSGTANAIYDHMGDNINKSRKLELLYAWIFNKVNAGCLLIDVSQNGGAILIPKNQPVPSEVFDLVIMDYPFSFYASRHSKSIAK